MFCFVIIVPKSMTMRMAKNIWQRVVAANSIEVINVVKQMFLWRYSLCNLQ